MTFSFLLLIVCCFVQYLQSQTIDDCRVYMSCLECFEDPQCGWCATNMLCVVGNSTGPGEGTCSNWNYYSCSGPSPHTGPTAKPSPGPSPTPKPSSPPPSSATWDVVGTNLVISNNGLTVTRKSATESWNTAWINSTLCSSGLLNVTIEVTKYYDDPDNYYNAVFGMVSQSCANSYTGNGINELIGWTSSGGCGGYSYIAEDGYKMFNDAVSRYGAIWTTVGEYVRMESDLTAKTITFYVNGKSQGVAFTAVTSDHWYGGVSILAPTTSFTIVSATCSGSTVAGKMKERIQV
jgi:hypothetical protein